MTDYLTERVVEVTVNPNAVDLIGELEAGVLRQLSSEETPVRVAVTSSDGGRWSCDLGILVGSSLTDSIFRYSQRSIEDQSAFNVAMIVPTGIGAEIGGHAGDATPAATLIASVCDTLVTHPNVLNASDIIQIPPNALYVEGSVISQLLMGSVALQRPRANRLLVLMESHEDHLFTDATINAVNAARASYGISVSEIVAVDRSFQMSADYTSTGVAAGYIQGLDQIWSALDHRKSTFDAVAISSVIRVPRDVQIEYYEQAGRMVNPWGGVEAMLTHAISSRYRVPAAHAPMFESRAIAELDVGVVDPRMAAEVVSITFLQCVLRGLQHAPRIMPARKPLHRSVLTVDQISCLLIPDGCIGLPTLAALAQGITVVAVRENANIMRNRLSALPWAAGQFHLVDNYLEAAGLLSALRNGIAPESVRRPIRLAAPAQKQERPKPGLLPADF